jgi:hypothetical protein
MFADGVGVRGRYFVLHRTDIDKKDVNEHCWPNCRHYNKVGIHFTDNARERVVAAVACRDNGVRQIDF